MYELVCPLISWQVRFLTFSLMFSSQKLSGQGFFFSVELATLRFAVFVYPKKASKLC